MKKLAFLVIFLGALLLTASGLLVFQNVRQADAADLSAQSALESLRSEVSQTETAPADPSADPGETTVPTEPGPMTETVIKGKAYIGYLTIPDLKLELPVLSHWSYEDLQTAPCRQCGTTGGNDLVIAAHNYPKHFGTLKTLNPGAAIQFTDMDGLVTSYEAATVEPVDPYEEQKVLGGNWDLVLYTCTPGGQMRVMVGANRTEIP